MKILVIGANGFVGRNVVKELAVGHQVITAAKDGADITVDLLDKSSIKQMLSKAKAEAIINCAGVVGGDQDVNLNVTFTQNLLQQIVDDKIALNRIIISGSAAVYGLVDPENIPVPETAPLNANAGYGLSKLQEEQTALRFRHKYKLPVTVARIFNPIGIGMHPRFLIPGILRQITEIEDNKRQAIEISRLDSKRDYIDIRDVAIAIRRLAEAEPAEAVYNIGSGVSTSNGELIDLLLKARRIGRKPQIVETADAVESLVAILADISRLKHEFSWKPIHPLAETIKELVDAARQ